MAKAIDLVSPVECSGFESLPCAIVSPMGTLKGHNLGSLSCVHGCHFFGLLSFWAFFFFSFIPSSSSQPPAVDAKLLVRRNPRPLRMVRALCAPWCCRQWAGPAKDSSSGSPRTYIQAANPCGMYRADGRRLSHLRVLVKWECSMKSSQDFFSTTSHQHTRMNCSCIAEVGDHKVTNESNVLHCI